MKTALRILFLLMVICGFIFSGNADAVPFAWFAQHYTNDGPTGEYFVVIADPSIYKAKVKG